MLSEVPNRPEGNGSHLVRHERHERVGYFRLPVLIDSDSLIYCPVCDDLDGDGRALGVPLYQNLAEVLGTGFRLVGDVLLQQRVLRVIVLEPADAVLEKLPLVSVDREQPELMADERAERIRLFELARVIDAEIDARINSIHPDLNTSSDSECVCP